MLHKLSTSEEVEVTLFVGCKIRKFVFPNEIRSRFMQIQIQEGTKRPQNLAFEMNMFLAIQNFIIFYLNF